MPCWGLACDPWKSGKDRACLLAQLQALREQLGGGGVYMVVGGSGFQLAFAVDTVHWPDFEDDDCVHRAARICGA